MYNFGKDGKNFNITFFKEFVFMEKSKMKNIVILKNLPSNLIEEAFVVVKSRKVARNLEYIDGKKNKFESDCKDDGYIVREAESVLSSYVNFVEKGSGKTEKKSFEKRYKMMKIYGIVATIVIGVMAFCIWF